MGSSKKRFARNEPLVPSFSFFALTKQSSFASKESTESTRKNGLLEQTLRSFQLISYLKPTDSSKSHILELDHWRNGQKTASVYTLGKDGERPLPCLITIGSIFCTQCIKFTHLRGLLGLPVTSSSKDDLYSHLSRNTHELGIEKHNRLNRKSGIREVH